MEILGDCGERKNYYEKIKRYQSPTGETGK
jgi:hypothetical protein